MSLEPNCSGVTEFSLPLLQRVTEKLDPNPDLSFEDAHLSLKWAFENIRTEEGQRFINKNMPTMIAILTNQNPCKVGQEYLKDIESALVHGMKIIMFTFTSEPLRFMESMISLLKPSSIFYSGLRSYHAVPPPSCKVTRRTVLNTFVEEGGFTALCNYVSDINSNWFGFLNYEISILSAADVSVADYTANLTFIDVSLKTLAGLTEKELKKESVELLEGLLDAIFAISYRHQMKCIKHSLQTFLLDYSLKLLNCDFIVFKLLGWKQMQQLIDFALSTAPLSKQLIVSGAGVNEVNGMYEYSVGTEGGAYLKQVSGVESVGDDTRAGDEFAVFVRAAGKTVKKWWYISRRYTDSDGKRQEAHYYFHHGGGPSPPLAGWMAVKGVMAYSPTLRRGGPLLLPDRTSENDFLIYKLKRWSVENQLISHIFRSPIHREVISKSGSFVLFLAEVGSLSMEHIELLWDAAMNSHESDVMDEIFSILVRFSIVNSNDELFSSFFQMILKAFNEQCGSGSEATSITFNKFCGFLDKFSALDTSSLLLSLPANSISWLLQLLWEVLKSPHFDYSKASVSITSLFSLLLKSIDDKCDSTTSMQTTRYLEECGKTLSLKSDEVAQRLSPVSRKNLPSKEDLVILTKSNREISSILKIMKYLFTYHADEECSLYLSSKRLPATLLDNLSQYITAHKPFVSNGSLTETVYELEMANRLEVLAQFYLVSSAIPLPRDSFQLLWSIMVLPCELTELFRFLKNLGVSLLPQQNLSSCAGDSPVTEHNVDDGSFIFTTMICNPSIDWSAFTGEGPFECFEAYFLPLSKVISGKSLLTASVGSIMEAAATDSVVCNDTSDVNPVISLGLESLWQIALNVSCEKAAKLATSLLLDIYTGRNQLLSSVTTADLLDKVFLHLGGIAHSGQSVVVCLSEIEKRQVCRCIQVINQALFQLSSVDLSVGKIEVLPHAANGLMGRIRIKTNFRKKVTGGALRSKVEEGSFHLTMHPLQSLIVLKSRIVEMVRMSLTTRVILRFNAKFLVGDSQTLSSFGIVDDCCVDANCSPMVPSRAMGGALTSQSPVSGLLPSPLTSDFDSSDEEIPPMGSFDEKNSGVLSIDSAKFDCLMSVLSVVHDEEVINEIWLLLMRIPTHSEWLKKILSPVAGEMAGVENVATVDWASLLGSASELHSLVYALQIIDGVLAPALDSQLERSMITDRSARFQEYFVGSGGCYYLIDLFVSLITPKSLSADSAKLASYTYFFRQFNAVALHILHYLLFDKHASLGDDSSSDSSSVVSEEYSVGSTEVFQYMQTHSNAMMERLLAVASDSSEKEDLNVVNTALVMMTHMLDCSLDNTNAITQFTSNPQSKTLLSVVFRSGCERVREMASDFAVKVGKSDPVVFSWLVNDVSRFSSYEKNCSETFIALNRLLYHQSSVDGAFVSFSTPAARSDLAALVSNRLTAYAALQQDTGDLADGDLDALAYRECIITGYFTLLNNLFLVDSEAVSKQDIADDFMQKILSHFLFPLPDKASKKFLNVICRESTSRKACFGAIKAYMSIGHVNPYGVLFNWLSQMTLPMMDFLQDQWKVQISLDVKSPGIRYTGLRNQGCTCYMNSLLQQLFMNVRFREAIMTTNLLEVHRSTLWHRPDEEIVGLTLLFENFDGSWKVGHVTQFFALEQKHKVSFFKPDGDVLETVVYNLKVGRPLKETGKYRLAPDATNEKLALTEKESAAHAIVEQLQRTFLFMKESKRRFFDPRPFVDACKTLNLSYNIYQQNDASEFCDQLLDRLETGMGGKFTGIDTWKDVVQKTIFGGQTMSQKVPKFCESYLEDKKLCEQWNGSREESFFNIELIIRGKESIDESLNEMIQGELMDGENKLTCDKCGEKKAVTRRMCIGSLPNTMILHLKRFDLDFTTFETVKLNNKIAFDRKLNMLKYTKEGVAATDELAAKAMAEEGDQGLSVDMDAIDGSGGRSTSSPQASPSRPRSLPASEGRKSGMKAPLSLSIDGDEENKQQVSSIDIQFPDAADFDYDLQGVVVHCGVAQGGHYFSIIKEDGQSTENDESEGSGDNKWFKFDDDDVGEFNPEFIPSHCFGGVRSMTVGTHVMEDEIVSNALMLFYTKRSKKVAPPSVPVATSSSVLLSPVNSLSLADASSAHSSRRDDKNKCARKSVGEVPLELDGAAPKMGEQLIDGYAAFGNEVWAANSHHILLSYLLDSNLHDFIRQILQSIAASMTGELLESDMLAVQHGCRFLFNIVLHCRERTLVNSWLPPLRHIFSKSVAAAIWLIRECMKVTHPGPCWLVSHLILCSESSSRTIFMQLLCQAVNTVSSKLAHGNIEEIVLLNDGELAQCAATDASALLVQCSRIILKYVSGIAGSAAGHLKNADELFILVRDLAAFPVFRSLLLQHSDILLILSFYILPEKAVPAPVAALFSHVVVKPNTRVEFKALTQSIYEAMAALLGVPQVRKVDLLQDSQNMRSWDQELTPTAISAFTTIFEEATFQTNAMDVAALRRYFDVVNQNSGVKYTPFQLRHIMECNEKNADGKLNLIGFLNYYRNAAQVNPKNVWMDLQTFGFQNDLTRRNASEVTVVADLTNDLSLFNNEKLLAARKFIFNRLQFYESGFDIADSCVLAITKKLCFQNIEFSVLLMNQALHRLFVVVCNRENHRFADCLLLLLHAIISVDDTPEFGNERVSTLLVGFKSSFLSVIESEREHPCSCRCNEYDAGAVCKYYLDCLKHFLPNIHQYLPEVNEDHPEELTVPDWFDKFQSIYISLEGGADTSMEMDENDVSFTSAASSVGVDGRHLLHFSGSYIVVSSAGTVEINGTYDFYGTHPTQKSAIFTKRTQFRHQAAVVYIYRCAMDGGSYCWFISITPEGSDPGTKNDTDYYSVASLGDSKLLPPFGNNKMNRWDICDEYNDPMYPPPQLPAPVLTLYSSDALMADDDEDLYGEMDPEKSHMRTSIVDLYGDDDYDDLSMSSGMSSRDPIAPTSPNSSCQSVEH